MYASMWITSTQAHIHAQKHTYAQLLSTSDIPRSCRLAQYKDHHWRHRHFSNQNKPKTSFQNTQQAELNKLELKLLPHTTTAGERERERESKREREREGGREGGRERGGRERGGREREGEGGRERGREGGRERPLYFPNKAFPELI